MVPTTSCAPSCRSPPSLWSIVVDCGRLWSIAVDYSELRSPAERLFCRQHPLEAFKLCAMPDRLLPALRRLSAACCSPRQATGWGTHCVCLSRAPHAVCPSVSRAAFLVRERLPSTCATRERLPSTCTFRERRLSPCAPFERTVHLEGIAPPCVRALRERALRQTISRVPPPPRTF